MTPNDQRHWMGEAIALAKKAAKLDEIPIGALLVRRGEVLASAHNLRESTGRTVAHAEILAIERFNRLYQTWRLPEDTTLFVTAEPCLMCTGALLWARTTHIVYGCADPKNAGLQSLLTSINAGTYDHRFSSVAGGVCESDCAELLKTFFGAKRDSAKNASI